MHGRPVVLRGTGRYLPARILDDATLSAECGVSPGTLPRTVGVHRRHRAAAGETASEMGARAVREALTDADLPLHAVDLIVHASGTPERPLPDGGPLVQRALGRGHAGFPAFSVHGTCLSFLLGIDTAASWLLSGRATVAVVVSSELTHASLDPGQPEVYGLFGDGAAAAVLTLAEAAGRPTEGPRAPALGRLHWATWGDDAELTTVRGAGTALHPADPAFTPEQAYFRMDGRAVLLRALRRSEGFLDRVRPGLGSGLAGVHHVVPHQTSAHGLAALRRFGWPDERIERILPDTGNCVAASIPLALDHARKRGAVAAGDEVLLVGTAAGLSMGAMIWRL